jgi:branched-chain amino acid transport system substrate-binding protein
MKKQTIISIIVFLAVVVGVIGLKGQEDKDKNGPIKVGVIISLSGDIAVYGQGIKKGIDLAAEEINQKGGISGRPVELIYEDDSSNNNSGVSAINKLIQVDKVSLILGAGISSITSAIAPIAEANKTVMILTTASAPNLSSAGDYIFRVVPSDAYQALAVADFMIEKGLNKKVAGLRVNDDYGLGMNRGIEKKIGSFLANEYFESSATDYRTQLTKIKNTNPQVLVVSARNEWPAIAKQIKELGITAQIIGPETLKDEKIFKACGINIEGAYTDFFYFYRSRFTSFLLSSLFSRRDLTTRVLVLCLKGLLREREFLVQSTVLLSLNKKKNTKQPSSFD